MIVMCEIQLRLAAEAWIRTGFSPLGRTVGNSWKYLVVRKLPAWKLLGRYPDDQRAEYADNWLGFQTFAISSRPALQTVL
jgi:hypothetical protein